MAELTEDSEREDVMGPRPEVAELLARAASLGFDMCCSEGVGRLLRAFAASKPVGKFLELGTGLGVGTAWLRQGMGKRAVLTTVELDETLMRVAEQTLGDDPRLNFVAGDAGALLETAGEAGSPLAGPFDLIFADAVPGKFEALEEALGLLAKGGFYVIDDLMPQPNWPDGHQPRVDALRATLAARSELVGVELPTFTGVGVWVRIS